MEDNEITFLIRKAILNVYNGLGPGLLESVYEKILAYELEDYGLEVKTQLPIPVIYNGINFDIGFRADILVEDRIIIEIKSVKEIEEFHHKQLLTYLKLANKQLGILVNFNTDRIDKNIFRKVNGFKE